MKISKNFTLEEMYSSATASKYKIDNTPSAYIKKNIVEMVKNLLQPLRDYIQKPLKVTSGYRCPQLNHMVGGSTTSSHMSGYAVDLVPPEGLDFETFCKVVQNWLKATKTPFDQLIKEKSGNSKWLHIGYKTKTGRQRYQYLSITK